MKNFKKVTAILFTVTMVFAMSVTALAIAIIDEDGNIIQENEPLPGGIVPLMDELDLNGEQNDFFQNFPAFESVTGEVAEFLQNDNMEFIRIRRAYQGEYEGEYGYFDFVIDNNTFIMGEAPEVGDTIMGFYDTSLPVPMIYPPQHTAVVLVNHDEDLPRVIVDRFNDEWISSGNQFRLNINEDTEIVFPGGDVFEGDKEELIGRKLVVEFTISHRDIPETIPNPQRITVLYERAVHPTIDIDWDYDGYDNGYGISAFDNDLWQDFEWQGHDLTEDIDWSEYDIIITINGLSQGVPNARYATMGESELPNYVPLRAITEMLGFTPEWNAERREITVGSPRGEITLRIGSPYYSIEYVSFTYTLDPPVIINNMTYVPVLFFREVFGFNNAWWAGGNISLDNSERME